MSFSERELLHAVGALYEAGGDRVAWQAGVDDLVRALGCRFVLLSEIGGPHAPLDGTSVFGDYPASIIAGLEEHRLEMAARDPTVRFMRATPGSGAFRFSQDAVTGRDDAYYRWHLDRCGSTDWQAFFAPERQGIRFGASFHFDATISSEQHAIVQIAFEHLERAHRHGTASPDIRLMANPAAVLTRGAEIVLLNDAARRLAEASNGIFVRDQALLPIDGALRARWLCRIDDLAQSADVDADAPMFVLPKSPDALPLLARLERLPGLFGQGHRRVRAIFIDAANNENAARSWAAFGLTRAESDLANTILRPDCRNVRDAAEELHVSYATARTQLNALFSKTRTHSQAQLVRVLQISHLT